MCIQTIPHYPWTVTNDKLITKGSCSQSYPCPKGKINKCLKNLYTGYRYKNTVLKLSMNFFTEDACLCILVISKETITWYFSPGLPDEDGIKKTIIILNSGTTLRKSTSPLYIFFVKTTLS